MSLVDAIPATIKEMGRIRAGKARNKAGWGQSLASIGQMVSTIPAQMQQQTALEGQQRRGAQQEQLNAMEIADKQREQAADSAINNAMSSALSADGSLDVGKLQAALAGTPAASRLPQILTAVNAMNKTTLDLQKSGLDVAEAEADHMGALAAAALAAPDADGRASIITAGIAQGQRAGLIDPAHARASVSRMLGDDGLPDPAKVDAVLQELQAHSSKQRTLKSNEAENAAQTAAAKALTADRETDTQIAKDKAALENFSAQLGRATTKEQYARIFAGVPANLKDRFDAPEAFDQKTTPRRSLEASMTAAELERKRADDLINADRDTDNAEVHRHNLETEATARVTANRPREGSAQTGEFSTDAKRGYDAWVENYKTRYPTETLQTVTKYGQETTEKRPVAGVKPPPSMAKWQAMTPAEREAVLANPNARISDAELAARQASKPAAATADAAPPAVKAAAASAAGMIIVTKPGTRQKFAFKTQADADATLEDWANEQKK